MDGLYMLIWKNHLQMDDSGVPPFQESTKWGYTSNFRIYDGKSQSKMDDLGSPIVGKLHCGER